MNKEQKFDLALVTGASSGIGETLSYFLADKGIDLIIHGRNAQRLEAVAEQLRQKVKVTILRADLGKEEERATVVEAIHTLKPDLIVNNAGLGLYGNALTHETSKQMEILNVNGNALLELSLEGARTMISAGKKGVIMNISSAAAWPVFPGFAVYGASKSFVNQFSESFDEETKPYGIRVLAMCPGVVKTNFRGRGGGVYVKGEMTAKDLMSTEFVAQEIWDQIQSGRKIRIIDWRYRVLTFLVKYIFPKSIVANLVRKSIAQRSKSKEIIKLK